MLKKSLFCLFLGVLFWTPRSLLSQEEGATARLPSLSAMVGQMICVGIGDVQSPHDDPQLLHEIAAQKVGGVVLFGKNLSPQNTEQQLRRLIDRLQAAAPLPLWIAIDEEGGRVNRLLPSYGFFSMPSARDMGQQSPAFTKKQALRMAQQLRSLGINLNFAPVVDLALHPKNNVIVLRGRSFGADPYRVTRHAEAFILAHRAANVCTVAKHFPGHGSSSEDTHIGLTDITHTWTQEELLPYRLLQEKELLSAVMTAHIVHFSLDKKGTPATLSPPMLRGLLRETLHFSGVIFSDDLQMAAIQAHYGLEEALLMAVLAGVDVLLVANNVVEGLQVRAEELHATLLRLVEEGRITEQRIAASYRRIATAKARCARR